MALVLALVLAGTGLRTAIYLQAYRSEYAATLGGQGGGDYVWLARSLLAGEGLQVNGAPSCVRTPLIPALFAFYIGASGSSPAVLFSLRIAEYLLGAIGVWALARTVDRAQAGVGVVALAMYTLNPYLAGLQLSLTEVGPTIVAQVLFARESLLLARRSWRTVPGGLRWGLAAVIAYLCRPELSLSLVLVGAYLLMRSWRGHGAREIGSLAIGSALLVVAASAWGVRNYQLFGEFVVGREDTVVNLWKSHHPQYEDVCPDLSHDALTPLKAHTLRTFGSSADPQSLGRCVKTFEPVRLRRAMLREIVAYYERSPGALVRRVMLKTWWAIEPRWIPVYADSSAARVDGQGMVHVDASRLRLRPLVQRLAHLIVWPLVAVTLLIGAVIARRTHPMAWAILGLTFVGYVVFAWIGNPTTRFRVALEPVWYPLCGIAVVTLLGHLKRASRVRRPRPVE